MKKLIIIYSILAIIALILIGVYVKISSVDIEPVEIKEEVFKKPEIAKVKKPLYFNLPARVLYMKVTLENLKNAIVYRLSLDVNDRYGLFNIKVLLNNHKIAYSVLMDNKVIRIYVLFKNKDEAQKIFALFRKYNFNVAIEKLVKRV